VTEAIDRVRDIYEQFERTGRPDPSHYTEDFVWDMSTFEGWPETKVYYGYDGMMAFLESWLGTWDEWTQVVREYAEAPNGEVVVVVDQRGRAQGTETTVEMTYASVLTLREGRVSRQRLYSDPAEAFASCGGVR
jgi:ketosteroid isomerase-like protein